MSLTRNQSSFGIHSVTAYNPDTLQPYGTAKVVGSLTFNVAGENIPLVGGSNAYPWEVESGAITAEGTINMREMPDWLPEAFLGNSVTTNAAETGGSATAITNVNGTSAVDATVGIASVSVETGEEANVKTGMYMVKVVSPTTVDVYAMTDVDFGRGTDLSFQDDGLKITASPLTVPGTGGTVSIPNSGLELTGGSGTIAMTAGDTAFYDARSINTGSTTGTIGTSTQNFVSLGLLCVAQKKGNAELFMIDIMKAKGTGQPFNFTEKAWSEGEIPFSAFYDSVRNGVFRYIRVDGS